MFSQLRFLLPALLWPTILAAPAPRSAPTVTLDNGTFVGAVSGNVNKYLGIPFAKPPTGDLRFRLPVANDPYTGTLQATSFGTACPQQAFNFDIPVPGISDIVNEVINGFYDLITPNGEDCLTVNVWTPTNVAKGTKLPVAVWIFGGGFEIGAPELYDGGVIVDHSISMGSPVVYVSMNYRVSAFGFLASAEVKNAGVGNLGLQDQRQALRWVQKYISAFNGDPTKVTIWGESAGAISAALHLVANNGDNEGLFRGAFMESGSTIPVGDLTGGQNEYDAIVQKTGCSGSADTLECLRQAPYSTLKAAVDQSPALLGPTGLHLAYLPRADGIFLTDNPQRLVQNGKVANVPFVNGNNDDEGTLFTLALLNITTDSQVASYLTQNYLPKASASTINQFMQLYPSDITAGSPYSTGILNALTPQFKRLASVQGDLVFQAPRRFLLQQRSDKQPTWSYLSKRFKIAPILGSFHATDLLNVYTGGDMTDYIINFVNNLDPNGPTVTNWPKYTNANPQLLTFLDGLIPRTITKDNYRVDQMNFVTNLSLQFPI
ncbi:carotenoid ester lipase precursor [Irpex rosettiformis]|uniref:Carotenoid ester lipase n=1 Tax=Irpex rosettiformis TaxID=378272 RepID=A0ACB8U2U4_9APHY|nr:carotenoid ester lipase precursor [Irpex rosettiformis]